MIRTLRRRPTKLAWIAILLGSLLAVESGLGALLRATPPLSVDVSIAKPGNGGLPVAVTVASARPWQIPVRASLLPGTYRGEPVHAYIFVDSSYTLRYGNLPFGGLTDVEALDASVQSDLTQWQSNATVQSIEGAQLPGFLASNPNATLVVAEYGMLPSTVFSNTTNLITPWIEHGGTLLWAGGPLGYFSIGPSLSPQALPLAGPYWNGQTDLVGFPVVDPVNPVVNDTYPSLGRTLIGTIPTTIASDLGIQYNGTLYGANVSELAAHGGIAMGYDTAPSSGPGAPSAVTSLAYIPLGAGGVYYFGGAISANGTTVPDGGSRLVSDIATLLAIPYSPVNGTAESEDAALVGDGATSTFHLVDPNWTRGLVLTVEARVSEVNLFVYGEVVAVPAGTSARD